MTNPIELVADKEAFSFLRGECEKIVNIEKRLPDFSFQHPFSKYFVIEHAYIFRKEFRDFLFKMSNIFEDESVNYMTISPDAIDYYYKHFSFFGLASFNPLTLVERYLPVIVAEMLGCFGGAL
jgi:hypothetical protein